MSRLWLKTEFPVLLLYNLDHQWSEDEMSMTVELSELFAAALSNAGHSVRLVCLENGDLQSLLSPYDPNDWLVFNWCEAIPGMPHSESSVAKLLEEMGFTFTGSDSQGLEMSEDKRRLKHALQRNHITTPIWLIGNYQNLAQWKSYPAIVKPAFEHSSIGISRDSVVFSLGELQEQYQRVNTYFPQPIIVEEFIEGREFTVSVLGNGKLMTTPIVEYDFSDHLDIHDHVRTYTAKHDPHSPSYDLKTIRLPAKLEAPEADELADLAILTYRSLNCRDFARMDFRQRDGKFFVIDVNHNPDISPDASLALAAAHQGIPYGELGSLLINLAARRHPSFGESFKEEGGLYLEM